MPPIHWVADSSKNPSCYPDRLPIWSDYTIKSRSGSPSAETAVRFSVKKAPSQLKVSFDHKKSWVKPEFAHPQTQAHWNASENLLIHEQLHFMISCLLTRQANLTLQEGGDPHAMVKLVKAIAQRINLQYDDDTKHGLNSTAQAEWEIEIQNQLGDVTLKTSP